MKLLLENLPLDLKEVFENQDNEIFTVREMGWIGKKNGELLKLIQRNKFDVLITMDKNISKQQNILKYNIAIIIINAVNNKLQTLKPFVPKIKSELKRKSIKGIIKVNL